MLSHPVEPETTLGEPSSQEAADLLWVDHSSVTPHFKRHTACKQPVRPSLESWSFHILCSTDVACTFPQRAGLQPTAAPLPHSHSQQLHIWSSSQQPSLLGLLPLFPAESIVGYLQAAQLEVVSCFQFPLETQSNHGPSIKMVPGCLVLWNGEGVCQAKRITVRLNPWPALESQLVKLDLSHGWKGQFVVVRAFSAFPCGCGFRFPSQGTVRAGDSFLLFSTLFVSQCILALLPSSWVASWGPPSFKVLWVQDLFCSPALPQVKSLVHMKGILSKLNISSLFYF